MKTEDVISALASMTDTDRRQIRAALSGLMPTESVETPSTDDESRLLDALVKLTTPMGIDLPPMGVIRRLPLYKQYRAGTVVVWAFVREHVKARGPIEELKALRVLMKMLLRRMERDSIPISARSISSQLSRVPGIVEDQFPGYGRSGMLRCLVTNLQSVSK